MEQLAEKFYDIDEQISELNNSIKTLKEQKETIGNLLLREMVNQNIESLKIKEKRICIKTQSIPESLNQTYLHESLSSFFTSSNKEKATDSSEYAESAVTYILENRAKSEKKSIKILKAKN